MVNSMSLSLREAIATWHSPVQNDQFATASRKPRNDNKSAARNDSEKTAVHDGVRNRRHLAMTMKVLLAMTEGGR